MKSKLIILGCGSSIGVPRIDVFGEIATKIIKKIIEADVQQLLPKAQTQS